MTTIYTRYKPAPKVVKKFVMPTMTQQQFKRDADINEIMRRYETTGYLVDPLHPGVRQPLFNDFTQIPDLQECQNALIDATNRFMELPARVRHRFDNDVTQLLEFLNDSANLEEAAELGLINVAIAKPAAEENAQSGGSTGGAPSDSGGAATAGTSPA